MFLYYEKQDKLLLLMFWKNLFLGIKNENFKRVKWKLRGTNETNSGSNEYCEHWTVHELKMDNIHSIKRK